MIGQMLNQYNVINFEEITAVSIRLLMTREGGSWMGIHRWKVMGSHQTLTEEQVAALATAVDKAKLTLPSQVRGDFQLPAQTASGKDISWESSNPDVIIVDESTAKIGEVSGETSLVAATDFEPEYPADMTGVGEKTVTIKPGSNGKYKGSKSATYEIKARTLTKDNTEITITPSETQANPTVSVKVIVDNYDYLWYQEGSAKITNTLTEGTDLYQCRNSKSSDYRRRGQRLYRNGTEGIHDQ